MSFDFPVFPLLQKLLASVSRNSTVSSPGPSDPLPLSLHIGLQESKTGLLVWALKFSTLTCSFSLLGCRAGFHFRFSAAEGKEDAAALKLEVPLWPALVVSAGDLYWVLESHPVGLSSSNSLCEHQTPGASRL